MPSMPLHQCSASGCSGLTRKRFCQKHAELDKKKSRQYDRERDQTEERKWYHSTRWRKASKAFLDENPLCAECLRKGRDTAAYLIDHIKPHNGDYNLFWNQENWQELCNACHEEKHRDDRWRK